MKIALEVERKIAYGYSGVGDNTKRRDTMKTALEVERKEVYGLIVNTRRDTIKIVVAGIAFLGLAAISGLVPVHAQDCRPNRDLVTIPTIESQNGRLRGIIMLADENRALTLDATGTKCAWQHLRYFKGYSLDDKDPEPWPSEGDILPGPTLRARVGDLIQLAFLNKIDIKNFPTSLDLAERGKSDGCDKAMATKKNQPLVSVQIYPNNPGGANPDGTLGDTMPNCIHGSSTANIHFHGTHTTPSTTGDNVLLYVRPALRNAAGDITGPIDDDVMKQIEEIWKNCESDGTPTEWGDLPKTWRDDQKALLELYDSTAPYKGVNGALPESMKLWPKNQKNLDKGLWPQYSLGAFPYCFRLPKYEAKYKPEPKDGAKMGQAPGTHWYHAHKHGSTALNVGNGMSGAFIIEGAYDDALKKFYEKPGLKEQVLVIQQLETALNLLSPGAGGPPPLSVNGRLNPIVKMRPGEIQMWRIINSAARSFVQFEKFNDNSRATVEWRQIAQDGVQFSYENYQRFGSLNSKFNLAGANRADLLVKAPVRGGDYELTVVTSVSDVPSGSNTEILLTVRVDGKEIKPPMDFIQNEADFPKFPKYLEDIRPPKYGKQRTLVYNTNPKSGRKNNNGKMPRHEINGKLFNGDFVDYQMTLNTVETWKIVNETIDIAHPFHIHINPFQIFEVFQPNKDNTCVDPLNPDTWKPCEKLAPPYVWWDTFAIPSAKNVTLDTSKYKNLEDCPAEIRDYTTCSGGTCTVKIPGHFKMRSFFADFTGQFVNHCHILAHEDRGMMQLIQVIEKTKNNYIHH